ncbi:D-alanyl-D-alanine carboxypeptidase/D-alanyl-D-alanine-endopeptidase [uncultured Thiothrix sp.]|uniref:D-alanyl-D-alanine carboxypeptidase/D-alanyl-D-alanine endopeptidase n=1 Tax=uncultured Thiothrix sp. TaxID=223185 RepID=UPI002616DA20|nr:D-alanyl-D-alanine carboxypeptidase/D-alanyl-D-alanine-endopeptidase [uncultured Thiothrix sp.]HMT94126.1 D-alanyl-D-alanine carboxypeptidase/D-alanyl-D-alanine-endopeptidase [Thiolinea sp.]
MLNRFSTPHQCSLTLFLGFILVLAVFFANPGWTDEEDAATTSAEEVTSPTLTRTPPQPAEQATTRHSQVQDLPPSVLAFMQERNISADEISVYVRDVSADGPLIQHEVEVPRNPASTMKLLTTWAALKTLGPAWTWDTEVWTRGELRDGVLHGDLVLKGYGDPFLVYESFWQLVHDLRLKGLQEITGDLIIDNSFFELPSINPAAFDGERERVYNAPPSALMFNFQATRLLFEPDMAANKVNVIAFPKPTAALNEQLEFVSGDCTKKRHNPQVQTQIDGRIKVSGSYIGSCGSRLETLVLSSPEEHVFNAFRDFWQMLGGKLDGRLQTGQLKTGDRQYYVHTSMPLAEQIRLINKWSNNVMTRQVMLTVGAKMFEAPATLEKGRLAVLKVLTDQGISTQGLVIDNGSGLSRNERVSARQVGELLQAIWRDPYMPEMLNSLPLLGQDGTLARRFRRSDLAGRTRLKTGTLRDVSAIAGYMLTRSGKRMIIVMQQNGQRSAGFGHSLQNLLLEWVFEQ